MTSSEQLDARLDGFLSSYGLDAHALADEVGDAFGRPGLIVATGSVVQGFGNAHSDIDVYAVVDADRIQQLPLMSYKNAARIEVCLYGAGDLRARERSLREHEWPPPRPDRVAWARRRRSLDTLTRFRLGLALSVDEDWTTWLDGLADGRLEDAVAAWWLGEAVRCRQGARWLLEARPLAACQRYCDAVVAVLQARAAQSGELYFTSKWLGRKFRRLDDDEGLAILRQALMLPVDGNGIGPYTAWCEERLAGLPDQRVGVRLAPGTTVVRLGRTSLVARWELRGVELDTAALPPMDDDGVLWMGQVDEDPGPAVRTLVGADMLWVGACA